MLRMWLGNELGEMGHRKAPIFVPVGLSRNMHGQMGDLVCLSVENPSRSKAYGNVQSFLLPCSRHKGLFHRLSSVF